jgi:DNA polymerase III subunit delta
VVAIKAGAVDDFLARPDPGIFCVLVYGPDLGLVNERASALARNSVDDPNDAFALVRLDGDALASEPERLLEEAHSVPMFGGRRAIWVRAGSRPINATVERLLAGPVPDARVVIEAGDLRKGSPLRTLCEKSAKAAALPCYADSEAGLARLVDRELASAGLSMDRDAREALLAALGADRLATRQEIEKLVLYAQDSGRITLADVDAAVADASSLAMDDAVDAVFAGNSAAVERDLTVLGASGTAATAVLSAALRHALQLHRLRAGMEKNDAPAALERAWPSLHFRRRGAVETALSRWSLPALDGAVRRLAEGVLEGRRSAALGEVSAQRLLASLAEEARRRR